MKKTSLNQVINKIAEGSLIKLTAGEYLLHETIQLTKSIRLIGVGRDNTIITGSGLELSLESASHHNIEKGTTIVIAKYDLQNRSIGISKPIY